MIERNIDYIQASLSVSEMHVIRAGMRPIPPIRFYKRGYLHPFGFRMYFGNPNSSKASVVGAGEVLGSLRNDQKTDAEIVDWFLSQDAEISRLDLAVTEWIEDDLVTLEDVEKWYTLELISSNLVAGGMKEIASISVSEGRDAETLYIGDIKKRGDKGIFRAYDKGKELNLGRNLATRLEIELKRRKAHNVAMRIASTNDIGGNFRTHFNVKSRDFERLMDAPAIVAVRGKNKAKTPLEEENEKRWAWLINQVAPALKQAIKDEREAQGGDHNLYQFLNRAGLIEEMNKGALALYRQEAYNKLVPKKKLSTLDLD